MVVAASVKAASEDIEPDPPGGGVVVTGEGLVLPVREVREDGYLVTTLCLREGLVPSGVHVRRVDVVLDPGHGGVDPGAVGRKGLSEEALNLKVALAAARYLRERGYSVLLTRTTDVLLPTVLRAEIARAVAAKAFVSIHHNGGAVRRSRTPGTEIYHQAHNPESRRLAGILYEEISAALSQYDIEWRYTVYRGANAVVRKRDGKDLYGVLRHSSGMAAALTEAAYLSNPAEERVLSDPAVQAVEASAIADGIVRYLTTEDPGSGYNGTVVTSRRLRSSSQAACVDSPPETGADSAADAFRYRDVMALHREVVGSLAEEGVLEGTDCADGLFCSDYPIRRWELAVWLVRVLEGPAASEPPLTMRFDDVDASQWWAPYVARLFTLGITRGCSTSPILFCPYQYVTRGQMASFIVRAFDLAGGAAFGYSDISDTPRAADVNTLAHLGLARECGVNPTRYCPHHPTTRIQAATLLQQAQGLLTAPLEPDDEKYPKTPTHR